MQKRKKKLPTYSTLQPPNRKLHLKYFLSMALHVLLPCSLFTPTELDFFSVLPNEQNDYILYSISKTVSAYDQEIPQSQTADKPMASWGRATQQWPDTSKTNKAKQPWWIRHLFLLRFGKNNI